jgi:hypothetical protein
MRWTVWRNPLAKRVQDGGRRNSTVHRKVATDDHRVELRRPPIGTDIEGGETDRCRHNQQSNHEAAGTREPHGDPA